MVNQYKIFNIIKFKNNFDKILHVVSNFSCQFVRQFKNSFLDSSTKNNNSISRTHLINLLVKYLQIRSFFITNFSCYHLFYMHYYENYVMGFGDLS